MVDSQAHAGESQIDWGEALRFFRGALGRLVAGGDGHLVNSLASDAALRLIRVARRERIEKPEAMMTTIAYRVYQDWKRKLADAPSIVPIDSVGDTGERIDIPDPGAAGRAVAAELASTAWLTFKALELIHRVAGDECRQYLKAYYLDQRDHADIAGDLAITVTASRKRKSRCESVLARWIADNRDDVTARSLREFLDRFEESQ